MTDFGFETMQEIQKELQEKYKHKWEPISPETGRNKLLWLIAEAGEVAQVIKKRGDDEIMNNADVRKDFVVEMCDILMYFNDVMLCYNISPDELKAEYLEKHQKNMKRW